MTDHEGRPISVEVFAGNTADPSAFVSAVEAVRTRFVLREVVMVGDRGMITSARMRPCVPSVASRGSPACAPRPSGPWPNKERSSSRFLTRRTWLRSPTPTIRVNGLWRVGTLRWPPSEPESAKSSSRPPRANSKRSAPPSRDKRALKGKDKIALRVGKVVNHYKMAKHFEIVIGESSLTFSRAKPRSMPRHPWTASTYPHEREHRAPRRSRCGDGL